MFFRHFSGIILSVRLADPKDIIQRRFPFRIIPFTFDLRNNDTVLVPLDLPLSPDTTAATLVTNHFASHAYVRFDCEGGTMKYEQFQIESEHFFLRALIRNSFCNSISHIELHSLFFAVGLLVIFGFHSERLSHSLKQHSGFGTMRKYEVNGVEKFVRGEGNHFPFFLFGGGFFAQDFCRQN